MVGRRSGALDRRVLAAGVGAVLVLTAGTAAMSASASTGTVPGSDTAAAVQSVLDRVLGPGNAVVTVSDTIRTSSGVTTTQQVGSGVAAAVQAVTTTDATGTTRAVAQQDAVGGTTTVLTTPAGSLVNQTVAVAVDTSHLGGRSLAAIRSLVSAAAGIVPSRGDRLTVVSTTFAKRTVVTAPAPSVLSQLLPDVVPLIWALGAVGALAVVLAAVRGRRRTA